MKNECASLVVSQEQLSVCRSGLEDLVDLLLRQINLARQGRLEQVEVLAVKGGEIVQQINDSGASQLQQTGQLRKKVSELYRELFLILSDRQSRTAEEIEEVRRGRRMIRAYRRGI